MSTLEVQYTSTDRYCIPHCTTPRSLAQLHRPKQVRFVSVKTERPDRQSLDHTIQSRHCVMPGQTRRGPARRGVSQWGRGGQARQRPRHVHDCTRPFRLHRGRPKKLCCSHLAVEMISTWLPVPFMNKTLIISTVSNDPGSPPYPYVHAFSPTTMSIPL